MTIFNIRGTPIPWMRAGRNKSNYYDKQLEKKAYIRTIVKSQMKTKEPFVKPLKLIIEFHMPIPISWTKGRRLTALKKPHSCIPDLDNMVKFICDALNKVLWVDDSQIYEIHSRKIYTEKTMTKTILRIESYKGEPLFPIVHKK